ncbi:MAG: hypothetical protein KJZ69_01285 [Phycisphaerales bacterium]|nr:hypothetical protein [Phycisphaerales bacterium]
MYSRLMRNWEVRLAHHYGRDHVPLPYRVGADWWRDEFAHIRGADDLDGLIRVADAWATDPQRFLPRAAGEVPFEMDSGLIRFPSRGVTSEARNRTAYIAYRPLGKGCPMVLAVPAWNTQRWRLKTLLPTAKQCGFGGASISLPYQDERQPEGWTYAEALICSDLGRTMRSMQQSIIDTMDAVSVLRQLGHRRIILAGFSVGSAVINILDTLDPRPLGVICVLCGDDFARCVMEGISTRHIRKSIEANISREQLDRVWRPLSAHLYVPKLRDMPRPLRAMLTSHYDFTFPTDTGRRLRAQFEEHGVKHEWTEMFCGHYTLSCAPFSLRFLAWFRTRLRQAAALPDGADHD